MAKRVFYYEKELIKNIMLIYNSLKNCTKPPTAVFRISNAIYMSLHFVELKYEKMFLKCFKIVLSYLVPKSGCNT